MKLRFYYHAESGSPFATYDPPEVVLDGPDGGLCHEVDEQEFYNLCAEHNVEPVIPEAPAPCCSETRNRIRIAVAAWAYEVHADPIMSDDEFDRLALSIDVRKPTARRDLDDWFREHFNPHTGMWVLAHPEQDNLESLYRTLTSTRPEPPALSIWEAIILNVLGHHTA